MKEHDKNLGDREVVMHEKRKMDTENIANKPKMRMNILIFKKYFKNGERGN